MIIGYNPILGTVVHVSAILLVCSTEDGEQATVKWLQWLLQYLPEFEKSVHVIVIQS